MILISVNKGHSKILKITTEFLIIVINKHLNLNHIKVPKDINTCPMELNKLMNGDLLIELNKLHVSNEYMDKISTALKSTYWFLFLHIKILTPQHVFQLVFEYVREEFCLSPGNGPLVTETHVKELILSRAFETPKVPNSSGYWRVSKKSYLIG